MPDGAVPAALAAVVLAPGLVPGPVVAAAVAAAGPGPAVRGPPAAAVRVRVLPAPGPAVVRLVRAAAAAAAVPRAPSGVQADVRRAAGSLEREDDVERKVDRRPDKEFSHLIRIKRVVAVRIGAREGVRVDREFSG